jgi:hypothetical protein
MEPEFQGPSLLLLEEVVGFKPEQGKGSAMALSCRLSSPHYLTEIWIRKLEV